MTSTVYLCQAAAGPRGNWDAGDKFVCAADVAKHLIETHQATEGPNDMTRKKKVAQESGNSDSFDTSAQNVPVAAAAPRRRG